MAATQLSKWISTRTSSSIKLLLFPSFRRSMQEKVTYEKEVEEQSRVPATLPDDVLELGAGTTRPDKPWTPNPNTGVFGPSDNNTTTSSTADQPVFSRPLDILDDEPSTE
ncbi:late embryogenesis abundant protein At5g17165-like [Dioscorea cayenensis subsp. rotundata]|uniref:Late embryogenesis abundant protein At5g17165-like n=1 Tax=Dioscorea cayennensis subsp. rotundata TaxID=55577 RepID=A0AB40C445_DIOCR|nr:late embryogenesis abundant protein At5g17165-like [Dioscorea cayenensis subsp. rotundata]